MDAIDNESSTVPEASVDAPEGGDAPVVTRPPSETAQFRFTGSAAEYFRIWIVNVFLSIVTLGIYSAWAKVRIKKYVYGHTLLGDLPFGYDANPFAILRGRLIAVALFALWTGLGYVSPFAQLALIIPLMFLVPALIVASLRFNARVSSYRNVGFSFAGDYGGALKNYIGFAIVAGLTMYGMLPWAVRRQRQWVTENTSYGDRRMSFDCSVGRFYVAHLPVFIGFFLFTVVVFGGMMAWIATLGLSAAANGDGAPPTQPEMPVWLAVVMGAGYLIIILAAYWTRAAVTRLSLDAVRLGATRLSCSMKPLRYTWIVLSNGVLVALSLGMMHPWGETRRLRYLASTVKVSGFEALEDARGAKKAPGSATGAETVDVFEIDAGF